MAEKERMDVFEFYSNAFNSWSDIFSSWTKTMESFPGAFRPMDVESWFKPFWGYMEDWNKVNESFTEMTKWMPLQFESVKDMSEAVAKGVSSYVKIYDSWLRNMDSVAREGYEAGRRSINGEEVETDKFFEALRGAYDDITTSVVESLKETPFAGIKEIDQAVKESLDSFSEEQKMAREFLNELFGFSTKMINLSTSALKEATDTFTDMVEKGTISADAYKSIMDAYGDTLKHSVEILRLPAALLPEYKDTVDDAISWVEKNLDVFISWLEINLKPYQAISKSTSEIYKLAEDAFKEGKISSQDEFYKRWAETFEKATRNLIENSQFYDSIPKFINSHTEFLKSTNKLYQNVMTPPYVTKEALDKTSQELKKVKSLIEKKPKAKAEK